ncbi:MAG: EAL domain-containing protein [Sorangiineae bacterium]|nr:EAL domain-containing protein [Sorangiineae bacterium]
MRDLNITDLGVAFQPIVDMSTGKTFAVEALARPRTPEFPNPGVLFDAAVRESATGRLGRMIREVTFESCPSIPVFVNLHPHELTSRWLVRPDDPISFHEAPVYLEITEAAAFEYFDVCMSVLKEVCARTGSHLVIDDLGAGHSNLKRVLELEPRVVKLDIALVTDIDKLPRKQILVRHLVNLFDDLGARVVAEGIETADEFTALRDCGVTLGQGYLLARPANPVPGVTWPPPR